MPPKVRITKEEIVCTAVALVREKGESALNARNVAQALDCSTQPVFSNFDTMDELRLAVITAADVCAQEYMHREIERGEYPPYKATGMAYIRFAREEKELFKLLYMRDRSTEAIPEDIDLGNWMESIVYHNTGLGGKEAKLFHLEMWAFVHGVAAMMATGFLDLEWDLVSQMLTDCYRGLKKQYEEEGT